MNRIGFGPPCERGHQHLEPLLEVAAEPRPGEQRAGIEGVDLGPGEELRHVGSEQALGQPLDEGGLAHARVADEHRVVLAPPAQHLERAADLGRSPDERVELARASALRQVDRVRRQRIGRSARHVLAAGVRRVLGRLGQRDLRYAVRQEVQHVEARDALGCEQARRDRLGLLQQRGQHVTDPGLVLARAVDVQHRGLQHALERERLHGIELRSAGQRLDPVLEVSADTHAQALEVRAAGAQDLFPRRIVEHGVQQVLEPQVRMAPRHRFAERDVEHHLECRAEHVRPPGGQTSSMLARSGNPWAFARSWTRDTLVSAISCG